MYRATYPPIRVITAAQQAWNPRITSRRSSGSSVAARTVEPTRSQKRTVSWRLSGSDCGRAGPVAGAPAAGVAPDSAAIALRIRFRWAERNAQFLQIGLGHIGQDFEIDGILGKGTRVLGEPDPIKPGFYLVIVAHCRVRPPKVLLHFPFKFTPHIALRARRERPCRRAAEQREELTSSYVEHGLLPGTRCASLQQA